MDIAKIRKKIKESEQQEIKPEDKQLETTSDREKTEVKQHNSFVEEKQTELKQESIADTEELKTKGKKATSEQKESIDSSDEIIEILTFKLLNEDFAFRITQLKEILKNQRITIVPKVPDYVAGITSLRGKVIPVIDLRTRVLSKKIPFDIKDKTKILIIKGPKGLIGAVIDKVSAVLRIAKSEILPPPSHLNEEQMKFIEGVAVIDKRFISILNLNESVNIQL